VSGATWQVGGASVRGAAHVRTGRPNQDALAWSPTAGQGERIAVAVSDGHGAPRHFRSGEGAALAVAAAVELLGWHLDDRDADDPTQPALPAAILGHWRQAVAAHLAEHPLDRPAADALEPYGATLVSLAAAGDVLTALQIGDGDLLLGYPDGRLQRPFADDEGLVGEQTYSLCLPHAERRFRQATIWRDADAGAWPDFALLASDGVAKSFRDDAAFLAAMGELRRLAATDWPRFDAALGGWLDQVSAAGSGDDSTLAIAVRRDGAAVTGSPA
jgi:hypothetical protein